MAKSPEIKAPGVDTGKSCDDRSKRKAPPPRPRGAAWPNYQRLDGGFVKIAKERTPGPSADSDSLKPTADPGVDFTAGEEMLYRFMEAFSTQHFNYEETEDGELRQYWCPHCDQVTAAISWQCERCGKSLTSAEIDDQIDKPPVSIPYDVARFLDGAFNEILNSVDPSDALALKVGIKRTTYAQYHIRKYAAWLVRQYAKPIGDRSLTKACGEVARELEERIGFMDDRTILNWYRRFYPKEK